MSRNRNSLASTALLRIIPSTGHALRNINPFYVQVRDLAAPFARALHGRWPSEERGRRECRGHAAPAVSRAMVERCAHEHTGSAEAIRHSLRDGLTAYTCSPRRDLLGCRRHPQGALASRELATSIGAADPHDFTVRLGAFVSRAAAATASHTAFVTIAKRPSTDEMGRIIYQSELLSRRIILAAGA